MATETVQATRTDTAATHGATLVTGASSGIGYELAKLFAAGGDNLILVARREPELEELATELRDAHGVESTVIPMDLTSPGAVDDLVDRIGEAGLHVDTLVNNAGFGVYGEYHETDPTLERSMLDLNVVALTEMTKRVVPGMVERRSGRILNVASVAAVFPSPGAAVYAATKAYVLSYSVALAEELRPYGITVTALCPGVTETEFLDHGGVDQSGITSHAMASAEEVARVGYEAVAAGKGVAIPKTTNRLMWHMTRLLSRSRTAKLSKDYWEG